MTHIDDGEDVEIVLVNEAFDFDVAGIVGKQVVGVVFRDHGGDPFPSVHRSVNDNGWLGALAGASVKVYPGDGSTLERVSRRHDLGIVRMRGHEVSKELQMVGICMVRVEPRQVRSTRCCVHSVNTIKAYTENAPYQHRARIELLGQWRLPSPHA